MEAFEVDAEEAAELGLVLHEGYAAALWGQWSAMVRSLGLREERAREEAYFAVLSWHAYTCATRRDNEYWRGLHRRFSCLH